MLSPLPVSEYPKLAELIENIQKVRYHSYDLCCSRHSRGWQGAGSFSSCSPFSPPQVLQYFEDQIQWRVGESTEHELTIEEIMQTLLEGAETWKGKGLKVWPTLKWSRLQRQQY